MAKILIIDDEPSFLKLLGSILGKAGHTIVSTESGAGAIKILKEGDPQSFQLVITDANMPEMNGYEAAVAIRTQFNLVTLPILMLTKKRNRQDVKKAVEVGITDYILKPINEPLLLQKIEEILTSGHQTIESKKVKLITPKDRDGLIHLPCQIESINEEEILILSPVKINEELVRYLDFPVLQSLGLQANQLQLENCERAVHDEAQKIFLFEASLKFQNLNEEQIKKIQKLVNEA